jgi:hypothetical protein
MLLSSAAALEAQPVINSLNPTTLTERTGDHVAFTALATGSGTLSYQWFFTSNNLAYTLLSGQNNNSLVLTNIQTANSGKYWVVVTDSSAKSASNAATLSVTGGYLPLAATNLVVVRLGDGAQVLSSNGNTIYLDQYTARGAYVSTIQVPDETNNTSYLKGSSSSLAAGTALLLPGNGPAPGGTTAGASDFNYEGALTLAGNQQTLNLAAYDEAYPFSKSGSDVTAGGGGFQRGFFSVNAFGYYSLAYTNEGLYSGGNHTIRAVVTLDGTNFWSTGEAGSAGIKYINTNTTSYAFGSGIPAVTGSTTGTRVVQIVGIPGFGTNLVFSDWTSSGNGALYAASGLPEPAPSGTGSSAAILSEGGQPNDFAVSPDGLTVYIADDRPYAGNTQSGGGIQRWDSGTPGSGYNWSYTLPALPGGATNGVRGLVADFSASATWGAGVLGAVLYATTAAPATNSLAQISDNGASSTPLVLVTAGTNQVLRGVRFGPSAVSPVSIALQPQSQTNYLGNTITLSVAAAGSAPFFYQWFFITNNVTNAIAGATGSTLVLANVQYTNSGAYQAIVSNEVPSSVASSVAALTILQGPPALVYGPQSRVETVGDHTAFEVVVSGTTPLYQWSFNGTNLPGATNSVLVLDNIQTTNSGTYRVGVTNIFGGLAASATLTVTTSSQNLAATNLVVARVGDGSQALSSFNGNTLYLDQLTAAGTYVNTIQIPDTLPNALIVSGGSSDGIYEGVLNLSQNKSYLNVGGFNVAYPYNGNGAGVGYGANPGGNFRAIAAIDAYGQYTLALTNVGLYSGGTQFRSVASSDGLTNFWTTGTASSAALKYVSSAFASGNLIPALSGGDNGTRVTSIDPNGNVVFTDAGDSGYTGLNQLAGEPVDTPVQNTLLINVGASNSPNDFAISPDYNTIYIADDEAFTGANGAGGIERWDNVSGSWVQSYTLGTGTNSTVGARGLTVNWSANAAWGQGVTGAVLFATTAETSGNRLIRIVDNGATSSAVVLETAAPNQILRGVRFGPVAAPAQIASAPADAVAYNGFGAQFTVTAAGGGPFTYQWQLNGTNLSGATQSTLSLSQVGSSNAGNYTVVVSNPSGAVTSSPPATLSLIAPPTAPYPAAVLADRPAAFWRLDETNSTTAYDYVGGFNGQYNSVTLGLVPGYNNDLSEAGEPAAEFGSAAGQSENSFVGGVGIDVSTNAKAQFSVEAWVNGPAQGDTAVILSRGASDNEEFALDHGGGTSGALRFFVRTAAGGNPAVAANSTFALDGNWHHVVGVADEVHSNLSLYIDGQLSTNVSIASSAGIMPPSSPLSIGAAQSLSAGTNYDWQYGGQISQVAIYRYALSSNQVLAHYYAAGIGPSFTAEPTNAFAADAGGPAVAGGAVVAGTAPFSYQWFDVTSGSPGTALPGQTNATLSLAAAPDSLNGGNYALVVTNLYGGATSSPNSILTVYSGAPSLLADVQPNPLATFAGFPIILAAQAVGTYHLSYQWTYNGHNLSDGGRVTGAQSNVLTIVDAQFSDAGSYQLNISNQEGSAQSSAATVTVGLVSLNDGASWTANGGAGFSSTALLLTDGANDEARSAFLSYPAYVGAFLATWTYQYTGTGSAVPADGTVFVLQDSSAGAAAVGGDGSSLGFGGIAPSVGFEFNLYGAATGGSGLQLGTNGATGNYASFAPIVITNGDPIGVTLRYAGIIASLVLTDAVTHASFSTNYAVNIPAVLGTNTAYVGFTAGTGADNSSQQIEDFFFTPLPTLSLQPAGGNSLRLSWTAGIGEFGLQENSSLTGTNWVNVTNAVNYASGLYEVVVPLTGGVRYYRLGLQ